jgi:bla regulator protein blaR1
MSPFHLQAVAEISAARIVVVDIVDSLLEGGLIALLAGAALRVRRRSSGIRFAVWFSALIAIAVLPMLNTLHSAPIAGSAAAHSAITLPGSWAVYLFGAWALIATVSLSRVFASLRHLRALRKSCVPVDRARLDAAIRATLSEGNAQQVSLCTSDKVQVPTAIGFFKPAVVIPAWLLDDLSAEELNQIVLHELAHLRRRDDWTNLIQQVVKALFFFHPAVWWIEKKLSLEREMACDDAVLAATAQPRAYAECLAHLAERTFIRRALIRKGVALAQAALGRMRHTSLRVAQILNPNRPSAAKSWKPALALIAVFAAGALVLGSKEPQLIAFEDASSARGGADAGVSPAVASASRARTPLDPIPASFITGTSITGTSSLKSFPHHRTFRAVNKVDANQTTPSKIASTTPSQPAPNTAATIQTGFIIESEIANSPASASLIHLATFTDATSETIFLLVETRDSDRSISGRSMCQIQMWRVTLFHPAPAAAKPIPNKET